MYPYVYPSIYPSFYVSIHPCISISIYIFFVQVRDVKEVNVPFPLSDILLIIFALLGGAVLIFYAWLQVLMLLVYALLSY
jgi:hypothetical protein